VKPLIIGCKPRFSLSRRRVRSALRGDSQLRIRDARSHCSCARWAVRKKQKNRSLAAADPSQRVTELARHLREE